ncbi:DUF3050 domain-containing protein [Prosthecobacter sp.]|jgi:hypothetical protein|uniref:DUF3050 domain-containing protein n=1 Tax=Prosthecobacter sp. TaxID=1965333 RepID=UPI0037CC8B29
MPAPLTNQTKPSDFQESLTTAITTQRQTLLDHRLYGQLRTLKHLAVFMEHHVFAVWDFMSLLKALQVRLTCADVPWRPVGNAQVRRLVNEIVLGEESDALPTGGAASHFELYMLAMQEAGAKTGMMDHFIRELESGKTVAEALDRAGVPVAVGAFVRHTFEVIERGRPHEIAAAFTYGREDLIPEMFTQLVHGLEHQFPGKVATLRYYLDRHIALDGDEHGEMGRQMVALLCEGNARLEQEATQAAVAALRSRIKLWDGIALAMENSEESAILAPTSNASPFIAC